MFLTAVEAESLRSQCWPDWVLGEGLLPGLQRAVLLLCPHMAERELANSLASSFMGTNPSQVVPPS